MIEFIIKYYQSVLVTALILLAALSHTFAKWKDHRDGKGDGDRFDALDFFILFFIAVFAGLMSGVIAFTFFSDSILLVGAFAGGGAFLGLEGLRSISSILIDEIKKRIGKK